MPRLAWRRCGRGRHGSHALQKLPLRPLLCIVARQPCISPMGRDGISMEIRQALTFDDVLLVPAASSILPTDTDTRTRLTREVSLGIPLIAAAMDTVTESALAIAMAQSGGLGVIHRNLAIAEQANEVRKVKKFEAGMVVNPVTISPDATLADALKLMADNRISGIPVVERRSQKLVGIVTNRDVRFATNPKQPISELMTKEKLVTVRENVARDEAMRLLHQHRIEKLIVVDDAYRCIGLITVKDIEKSQKFPHASKDDHGRLRVAAATGTGDDGMEGAEALIDSGADAVKVGIGPGSICTTRIVAGVGMPQLSAILDVVAACRKKDVPVIADGGIKFSGDLAKAIAAGADCVMLGSLFAGTDESPGEVFLYQGRTYKSYRGMGSVGAMARGSADRYFQQEVTSALKLVPEGVEGRVPHKGPVANVVHQLIGGLRAAMGYTGNRDIAEMQRNCRFVQITGSGLRESHVHDIAITREAPNYRQEI